MSEPASRPIVVAEGLTRVYRTAAAEVTALHAVSLTVPRGQLLAVRGRSGSGKTTLLNLLGSLDKPDAGRVAVAGRNLTELAERDRLALRRNSIGFVFQSFGLVPILSAAENVGVPLRLAGTEPRQREERVRLLLDLVGLGDHAAHRPYELSGGQQQRVAIARALANDPELLLADEPTGQLDSHTGRTIMSLITTLVRRQGLTAVVATHDPSLITMADRVVELRDGRLVADSATTAVAG